MKLLHVWKEDGVDTAFVAKQLKEVDSGLKHFERLKLKCLQIPPPWPLDFKILIMK